MTYKSVAILCLVTAAVSASITKFYFPSLQSKTVETTKETVKNNIQTVIKTVTQPNGQVESTTTITDRTTKTDLEHKTDIVAATKDWLVSGSYSTSIRTLEPIYGIQVNRRILGPAYIGALLNTKGEVGLSIGLEF